MAEKDETLEMARLYQSGMKMRQIGDQYGISRQRVQQILSAAGITGADRPPPHALVDRKRLEILYLENLPLGKIAEAFGMRIGIIKQALDFYKIPKREPLKTGGCRVDVLNRMKIGDTCEIASGRKTPYGLVYTPAKKLGIKVSVRFLGEGRFEVTRVG